MLSNDELIDYLEDLYIEKNLEVTGKSLSNKRVLEAMRRVDRFLFLEDCKGFLEYAEGNLYAPKELAYTNQPLPIGFGQTCSQPETVAIMNFLLELEKEMNVLEVGSGCGYHIATVLELIHPGLGVTIEIIPELSELGKRNIQKLEEKVGKKYMIEFVVGDGSKGYQKLAPYDRIYFTASAPKSFDCSSLLNQLKPNGKLLYPVDVGDGSGPLYLWKKYGDIPEVYGSFRFVPLRSMGNKGNTQIK
ncbi:MAG: protein-L-isoaspartate O-methyltransferase [Candidatus Aenigmarchaeota archaeon]|nr:protein-L-isoaspartate O-methyltransferase [Candidatus Aenigmarchaeota archaeon]